MRIVAKSLFLVGGSDVGRPSRQRSRYRQGTAVSTQLQIDRPHERSL